MIEYIFDALVILAHRLNPNHKHHWDPKRGFKEPTIHGLLKLQGMEPHVRVRCRCGRWASFSKSAWKLGQI